MTFFRCLAAMTGLTMFLTVTQAQSAEAERVRIENRRQQLQAEFAVEDAACHQKFAVNSCLNEINTKHREAMADLRRQEISLNDDERKRRGAEQIRRVEEKRSAANHQESIDRRAQMFSEYEIRASREREANKTREERTLAENRLSDSPVDMRVRKKQIPTDGRSISDSRKADQYLDRQNQARERRVRHEAVASKRPPSTAKPLPVPP